MMELRSNIFYCLFTIGLLGAILPFKRRAPIRRDQSSREAIAKLQMLSPFEKMAEKHGSILIHLNSLTTKKQRAKFSSANFQKVLRSSYIILRIQRREGKQGRSR